MATPAETPQEFKYETKFVLLNYLGILPKFEDIDGDESDSEENEDSEELDHQVKRDNDLEELQQIKRIVASSLMSSIVEQGRTYDGTGELVCDSIEGPPPLSSIPESMDVYQPEGGRASDITQDSLEYPETMDDLVAEEPGLTLETRDLVKDGSIGEATRPKSKSSKPSPAAPKLKMSLGSDWVKDGSIGEATRPKSKSDKPSGSRAAPQLKVSSPRPRRESRKRKSQDNLLDDDRKKDRMKEVLTELEATFRHEMQQEGLTSQGVLCAISREAIVAERIAQIGDSIMIHHSSEFDEAFRQIRGMGGASMNYGVFKNVMGNLVKNTVPGWYHVAVMMRFTKLMAVGVLDQGSKGIAAVTDLAAKYIEENLAPTIIEQGGWDALTNVDLDQIQSDLSGTPSPYSLQSPTHPSPPNFIGMGASNISGTTTAGITSQSEDILGAASQSQEPMEGLNSVCDIAAPQSSSDGQAVCAPGAADSTDSAGGQIFEGTSVTQRDSPGSIRRRVQSDRGHLDEVEDEEPYRRRSSSYGTARPLIATAATATVAAVAAAGAYALFKK